MGFRSPNGGGPQMQMSIPFTKAVKVLVIINVVVWLLFQLILERYVLGSQVFTDFLALQPGKVVVGYIWQTVTYMFAHATTPTHIIFNLLILWMIGSELENHWGSRFFTTYYFVCGVGAALIYVTGALLYAVATNNSLILGSKVVGASGAIFGLMLAYGILFGERIVYFMFVFPMKARYFIMILGAVELIMLLENGLVGGEVANLAHLGGIISGFVFLWLRSRWLINQRRGPKGSGQSKPKLKLVVDNDPPKNPRFWN